VAKAADEAVFGCGFFDYFAASSAWFKNFWMLSGCCAMPFTSAKSMPF
jgi:hypothetical protein